MEPTLEFKAFRDFTPQDDVLIFKIKLDICSLLVTEKNMEQAHQLLMIQFLKNEFKDMAPFDIQDSVQKYLSGKLQCDTKFCTKMSAEFMGVILKAYRIYKREKHFFLLIEVSIFTEYLQKIKTKGKWDL